MSDINLSRKLTKIEDLPSRGELLLVSDQQQDKVKISDVNISASSFLRLGMLGAVVENSHLTQSHFEDSYFRKADFKNVNFTGSKFHFCNFDKASFQVCNFKYCTFYHCKLPADEIIACMPTEPNLRKDLARNLRSNSEMIGDKKTADRFLDIEIQASEDLSKAIFLSNTKYYKDNYNFIDQVREGLKYFGSKISGLMWGYGHRVGRLFLSYITVTILSAFVTYFGKIEFLVNGQKTPRPLSFWECIYMGFGETLGAINISLAPVTIEGKFILLSSSFLGTLFLALLAATIYRRIAR